MKTTGDGAGAAVGIVTAGCAARDSEMKVLASEVRSSLQAGQATREGIPPL